MRWVRRSALGGVLVVLAAAVANAVVLLGGRSGSAGGGAPVALVLGAGLTPDGAPSLMLDDRLVVAARLYHHGTVRKVLASGDHGTVDYDEVGAMRARLVDLGVAEVDLFTDHAGFDTWSSVVRAKRVFGASHVVVVTQRFHLSRAVWLARRAGLDATGVPADLHRYGAKGDAAEARELLARVKAVGEVTAGRMPRFLGPPIDLAGDGRSTIG